MDRSRFVSTFAALALAACSTGGPSSDDAPDGRQTPFVELDAESTRTVAVYLCAILKTYHYSQRAIDDALSSRMFDRYIDALDPEHIYFAREDIAAFGLYRHRLDDQVCASDATDVDLTFANVVFDRLVERLNTRRAWIREAANYEWTAEQFATQATVPRASNESPFPREAELKELVRRRVRYRLAQEIASSTELDFQVALEAARQSVIDETHATKKELTKYTQARVYAIFLNALATAFDSNTNYLTEADTESQSIHLKNSLDGIGASLTKEANGAVVERLLPGGAAIKDGRLQNGDRLVGVGQGTTGPIKDIRALPLEDAVSEIRGKAGTIVRLQVAREGLSKPFVLALTRSKVELEESKAKGDTHQISDANGNKYNVLVLTVPSFYGDLVRDQKLPTNSVAYDVRDLIRKALAREAIDAVVLELSNNRGGAMWGARALAGLFIDHGPIVQTRYSGQPIKPLDDPLHGTAGDLGTEWDGPLVVRTNKYSASASEIVAATLSDYDLSIGIGDSTTWGKGTVQVFPVSLNPDEPDSFAAGSLKLTIQKYYRVNGESTHPAGYKNDIQLASTSDQPWLGMAADRFALPFDRTSRAQFTPTGRVTSEIRAALDARSQARQQTALSEIIQARQRISDRHNQRVITYTLQDLRERRATSIEGGDDDEDEDAEDAPARYDAETDPAGWEVLTVAMELTKLMRGESLDPLPATDG